MSSASRVGPRYRHWQRPSTGSWLGRRTRALLASLALLALVILLASVTLRPLAHPRAYLFTLTIGDFTHLQAPPLAYTAEDVRGFAALAPGLADAEVHAHTLHTPADLATLRQQLQRLELRPNDVLLLYVATHGLTRDGVPYLLCEDFSPATGGVGRVPVSDVLQLLREQPTGTKLLLVDAARWPDDARLGMLANDFTPRLLSAVTASGDPTLWAISAQQTFEPSRRARADRRTVFAHSAQRALTGAADRNADRLIEMGELYEYVVDEVAGWSARVDGDGTPQRPVLAWGGGVPSDQALTQTLFPVTLVTSPADTPAESYAAQDHALWHEAAKSLDAGAAPPAADLKAPATAAAAAETLTDDEHIARAFAEAWQLLSNAEAFRVADVTPAEYAPAAWHSLHEWLLWQEWRFRAGESCNRAELRTHLTAWLTRLRQVLGIDSSIARVKQVPACVEQFALSRPRMTWADADAASLAELPVLAEWRGTKLAAEQAAVLAEFTRLLRDGSRAAWQTWLEKLGASADSWDETRLARLLLDQPQLDESLFRAALATRHAAQLPRLRRDDDQRWLAEQRARADQLRLAAEQELFDRAGAANLADASRWLTAARQLYDHLQTQQQALSAVRGRYWSLLQRVPDYIRWARRSSEAGVNDGPPLDVLRDTLDVLRQIAAHLESPDPRQLATLVALDARLITLQQTLDQPLQLASLETWLDASSQPGRVAQAEAILATALIGVHERLAILANVTRLESESRPLSPGGVSAARSSSPASLATWRQVRQFVELEVGRARLALEPGLSVELHDLESAATAFEQLVEQTTDRELAEDDAPLWSALHAVGDKCVQFYNALPREAERLLRSDSLSSRTHQSSGTAQLLQSQTLASAATEYDSTLVRAQRLLALVDPRDEVRGTHESQRLLHRSIEFTRSRTRQSSGSSQLQTAQTLASSATNQVAASPTSQRTWQLPTTLDLSQTDELPLVVELTARGEQTQAAWLVWKYDPTLLDVQFESPQHTLLEHQLRADKLPLFAETPAVAPGAEPVWYPLTWLPQRVAPTLKLLPGDAQIVRGRVRAVGRSAQSAKLIATLVTDQEIERREIDVTLPTPQSFALEILGVGGTVARDGDTWRLQPFPNRDTAYQLSLVNQTNREREVSVRLLTVDAELRDVPTAMLSAEQATAWLGNLGTVRTLAQLDKLALSPDDRAVPLPFPAPAEDTPAATTVAPPRNLAQSVDRGLIVAVTDLSTQQQSLQAVQFTPQRPRRYVLPKVRYNVELERIEIDVVPVDRRRLPSGPVRVSAEIVEPLAPGALKRLQGVLQGPDYATKLYAEAPLDAERVFTVRLSVDDYPRAFVYRVRCEPSLREVPECTDLHEVRITAPRDGLIVSAPQAEIDVALEIDAPPTAFTLPGDQLEIGLDIDRSRDFEREPTTVLRQDRQVELDFRAVGPHGAFVVHAAVHDFRLKLSTEQVQNVRAAVLARLVTDDRSWWSNARDVIFDGEAPRIERVERSTLGAVEIGKPVQLVVIAQDGALAGVGKVEAAFDPAQLGEFAKEPPPVPGVRQIDGSWRLEVPTAALASGTWPVLVRASDRAHNAGDYRTVKVRVATADELAAERARQTNRVAGRVTYGNEGYGEVKITLANEAGKAVAEAKTDADGNFLVAAVPPGKYKLTASGIVRNKQRTTDTTITVAPPPGAMPQVRLILK